MRVCVCVCDSRFVCVRVFLCACVGGGLGAKGRLLKGTATS